LAQAIWNLKIQAAVDMLQKANNPQADDLTSRALNITNSLEQALSTITGSAFSFIPNTRPESTLFVRQGNTEMSFNSLPDGLRSLIGWMVDAVVMMDVWLEGKGNITDTECVFLLDEVESHLHPAWQRRILPAFQRLFPKAQIFVATHSPFVISSLNHGWIHPLKMEDNGTVTIPEPISASAGDSYISVLEDVMGLREWYDPETEALLSQFRDLRDKALRGDSEARIAAEQKAVEIGERSTELHYLMGQELNQLEKRLGKRDAKTQPAAMS
jgi:predicted ATP-binding protein involved in virulence